MPDRREQQNFLDRIPAAEEAESERCQSPLGVAAPFQLSWRCALSAARHPASPGTWRAEQRHTTAGCRVLFERNSLDDPESTPPARFIEEVKCNMRQEADAFAEVCPAVLVRWRVKRPVDEHRPPDDVFLGN